MARAFYRKTRFLILDEATSALDNKTEKEVMETIRNLADVTILIVTHRPSTIKYCNEVIKIDKGSIVKRKSRPVREIGSFSFYFKLNPIML